LLIALPVDVPPAKAIQVLKANSSRWLHEHGLEFKWQEGYGAYEAEFETMIRKSGIAFDADDAFGVEWPGAIAGAQPSKNRT